MEKVFRRTMKIATGLVIFAGIGIMVSIGFEFAETSVAEGETWDYVQPASNLNPEGSWEYVKEESK